MPLYFFDIDDGDKFQRDDTGVELSGPEEARIAALNEIPEVARDMAPDGNSRQMELKVRNHGGRVIFEAELSLKARWVL